MQPKVDVSKSNLSKTWDKYPNAKGSFLIDVFSECSLSNRLNNMHDKSPSEF